MTEQAIVPPRPESLDVGNRIVPAATLPRCGPAMTRARAIRASIVARTNLVEVATAVRDDLGYDYLSSATAVDYLGIEDDHRRWSTTPTASRGGAALVFKAQTPRDDADAAQSWSTVWPGADFQEREAYDLMGIRFAGHPNLKRILMWEGFDGHPLRKDWKEAVLRAGAEALRQPLAGGPRLPRRRTQRRTARTCSYPAGFTLDDCTSHQPSRRSCTGHGPGVVRHRRRRRARTEQLVVNLGPQHPSTHGVFRMVVTLDGETIAAA